MALLGGPSDQDELRPGIALVGRLTDLTRWRAIGLGELGIDIGLDPRVRAQRGGQQPDRERWLRQARQPLAACCGLWE